ncbi:MAG: hypothetical protein H0V44_07310 [Planctomycetes bacterium]|nr:hypothetical protein [Planctomycetota bacterium]
MPRSASKASTQHAAIVAAIAARTNLADTDALRLALEAAYEAGRHHDAGMDRAPWAVNGDLALMNKRSSAGDGWVEGYIAGYSFCAKVYPEHADIPSYEIGRSRISKLEVRSLIDRALVYRWDRGLDVPALNSTAAAVVEAITDRLARMVFPDHITP